MKFLATTATVLTLACLATVNAGTSSNSSKDKVYPSRSDGSVMEQNRTMTHEMKRDMKKTKHMMKDRMDKKVSQTKVREVQEALDSRGYAVGEIDGRWGPRTSSALKDFQSAQGIEATGHINTETFNALGIQSDSIYSE